MLSTREENIRRNDEFFKSLGFKNPITDKTSINKKRKTPQPALKEAVRKSERSNKRNNNGFSIPIPYKAENCKKVVVDSDEIKYQKFAVISSTDLKNFIDAENSINPQNAKITNVVLLIFRCCIIKFRITTSRLYNTVLIGFK
jgi:hypothetical protein